MITKNCELLIIKELKKIGVKKGDILFVQANLSKLFKGQGISLKSSLEYLFNAIFKTIGKNGTLVSPAFYWNLKDTDKYFDIDKMPISNDAGIFAKYLNTKKKKIRSVNPITSVISIGKYAREICNDKIVSGWGVGSPYDILTKKNAKYLTIGVDLSYLTYAHYVEHSIGSPLCYNKYFNKKIIKNNKVISNFFYSSVRYKNLNLKKASEDNTRKFIASKIFKKKNLLTEVAYVSNFKNIYDYLVKELNKDIYFFLKKEPIYNSNDYPLK